MGLVLAVAGVFVGLLGGLLGGYWLGGLARKNSRQYWALNGASVLLCVALDFVGLVTGQVWLALGAVGLLAGLLTGLKYGYSESIGAWRIFDTWMGTDEELRPPKESHRKT